MTTYNWKVNSLYTKTIEGEQNYVVIANYEVIGTDDTYTFSISNKARFSTEKASIFIPYEDLTNDIVIGWIKQELGPNGITSIEAAIEGQINSQKNPPVVPQNTPLPPNFNN